MEPSSYIKFVRKVKGMGWNERFIARKFRKEVDKDDYAKSDARRLIKQLVSLSKVGQNSLKAKNA